MSYLISNLSNIHLVACLFFSLILWACVDLKIRVRSFVYKTVGFLCYILF